MQSDEIQIRDPFILTVPDEGTYYLFGTTDPDCWRSPGIGFDVYLGRNLKRWEGPYPAFRPEEGFWGTRNFWAPEVHPYRGKYYMFASFYAEGRRRATQVLVAERPQGPYRVHSPEPLTPSEWDSLDGTLFIDDRGDPWLVFCHEWVQVRDGEIVAVKLSRDLQMSIGEPLLLFKASEASWTRPHVRRDGSVDPQSRVTDGPFLHRCSNGNLVMLWSSFSDDGYAIGQARSSSGSITGPWVQHKSPLINRGGGHGMTFKSLDGRIMLALHQPNETPNERPRFFELTEEGGFLALRGGQGEP